MTREKIEGYAAVLEYLHGRFFGKKGPKDAPHVILCNDGTIGSAYGLGPLLGIDDAEWKGKQYAVLLCDDLYLNALLPLAHRVQQQAVLPVPEHAGFIGGELKDARVFSPRATLAALEDAIASFNPNELEKEVSKRRIRAVKKNDATTLEQTTTLYRFLSSDGNRYAGALVTFELAKKQDDTRAWASKSFWDYMTFKSGLPVQQVTNEYVLMLPTSLNEHLANKGEPAEARFGTELKRVTEQSFKGNIILDCQYVVDAHPRAAGGLFYFMKDWMKEKRLILGNTSSTFQALAKDAAKAFQGHVTFAELAYPFPRQPSSVVGKDFDELTTSPAIEAFIKQHLADLDANSIPEKSLPTDTKDSERESIDVRGACESAPKQPSGSGPSIKA